MGTDRNRRKTESRWRVGSGGHCFGMGPFSPVALTGVDELIEWGHSLHIYIYAGVCSSRDLACAVISSRR